MMHPHNKTNQIVTAQAYTISSNRHTPISCKFLLKFTHKLQLAMHNLFKKISIEEKNKKQLIMEALKRDPEIIFLGTRPSILVGKTQQVSVEIYKDLLTNTDFHQFSVQPLQTNLKGYYQGNTTKYPLSLLTVLSAKDGIRSKLIPENSAQCMENVLQPPLPTIEKDKMKKVKEDK